MFAFLRRMVKTAAILLAVSLAASYAADKVKIGMYVDTGVSGAGVMGWAKILSNSPQVELILLDVADIRGGKLRECDVLLMPGGSTGREFRALGKDGVEAIRKYVAEGGKYIGVCAGCGLGMNIGIGLRIVNCGNFQNTDRGQAVLPVRITGEGAKLLGINPGIYHIQYANGPIPDFTKAVKDWDGTHIILAKYESTLGKIRYVKKKGSSVRTAAKHPPMYGYPAIVFATYGKGKVLISGPHPEKFEATYPIALGYIHAVTGVKCTYVAPRLGSRPIRVAFHTGVLTGKNAFNGLIALFHTPGLHVYPGADFGTTGSLDHADVLVLPDAPPSRYKNRISAVDLRYIKRFQDRGGIVIAFGEGVKYLPVHKNSRAVNSWQELAPTITGCFK